MEFKITITIEKYFDTRNFSVKKGDESKIKSQVYHLLQYLDLSCSDIEVEISEQ